MNTQVNSRKAVKNYQQIVYVVQSESTYARMGVPATTGLRGKLGTTTAVPRFEFPEKPKALTMPAEEGGGFEDEEAFFPVWDATGEEDVPEAIGLRKGRLFDLAMQDDELLAEQGILSNEVGSAARELGGGAEHNRVTGGLGELEQSLFERGEQADE